MKGFIRGGGNFYCIRFVFEVKREFAIFGGSGMGRISS